MNVKRLLRFGNTEEIYRFCPEEILYMQAVTGERETIVFMTNNKDYYCVPNGLGHVAQVIDETLRKRLRTSNTMVTCGRSTIINKKYLGDVIGTGCIRLVAEVDGVKNEVDVKLPVDKCEMLAKVKGLSKAEQKEYQRKHFPDGYVRKSFGGGGGRYTGFMIETYEACDRPESFYDIQDDEIMFLGV